MKKQLVTLFAVAFTGLMVQQSDASVVVSNLDPANTAFGFNAPEIGQSLLTGSRPISLTSVQFIQTGGLAAGETFSVYSRNTDGSVGSSLFSGFSLSFDSTMDTTTATVTGAFTLQANSGYYFVLNSNSTSNIEWSYTSSTDYAAAFGASLPVTKTSFDSVSGTTVYYNLSDGPQLIQVNGTALAAVPEPSAYAFMGLALAGGVVLLARRRRAPVA